jgi:uncharacterized protein
MSHRFERVALPAASFGTGRWIAAHRFGPPGARPKAYIQAGLHANELPGQLVAHHLLRRLVEAERAGAVTGEIIVVPAANPIGLSQQVLGRHIGRFELESGANFNRAYPDLTERAAELLAGKLGSDAVANAAAARAALAAALGEQQSSTEAGAQRLALMRLAIDANIVLDLHCDTESELHLYVAPGLWPGAADLAAALGAEVVLLAAESGGNPFDESFSAPWAKLAARFGPAQPIPANGCLAATVELRGVADVDDALAAADAAALLNFLQRRGFISGPPSPLPAARCQATPLAGVDVIKSPVPGLIVHARPLGSVVAAGDTIAEIVDPTAADPARARTALLSRASGRLFTRAHERLARPGQVIAKIAGAVALPDRTGNLLEP